VIYKVDQATIDDDSFFYEDVNGNKSANPGEGSMNLLRQADSDPAGA